MAIGADGSDTTIGWIEESVEGTTPATPAWQKMRSTGNGLRPTLNKAASDEITSNASVTDIVPTQGGADGDINFEPSYGATMDMMFEHTLRGSFDEYGILKAGNAYKQASWERIINANGTPFYFRYPGARVNSLAITFDSSATSPITATLNIMAREELTDTSIISGATYINPNSNPVMSMPELRALYVQIDGVDKTACFSTLSPTFNNNLRSQQGKCTGTTSFPDLASKGNGYGRREVTLDVGYYFNDLDFVEMFQENTSGYLSYVLSDGTRGYKITYPNFKIMESSIPIDGNASDVIQTMSIQALYDTTEETDSIVEKIGNLATGAGIQLTETTTTPSPDFRGTYYKDGTENDGKDVYASVDGLNAIWWSTSDAAWTVTAYGDIGSFPVAAGWENTTALAPTGSWVIIGTATGDMEGAAYDPLA